MIRCPLMRIKINLATEATAPRAKKVASKTAAVGIEIGRLFAWPEKMSMMRPIQSGIDSDTSEETKSCRVQVSQRAASLRSRRMPGERRVHTSEIAIAIVFRSGRASCSSLRTSLSCTFSLRLSSTTLFSESGAGDDVAGGRAASCSPSAPACSAAAPVVFHRAACRIRGAKYASDEADAAGRPMPAAEGRVASCCRGNTGTCGAGRWACAHASALTWVWASCRGSQCATTAGRRVVVKRSR